MEDIYMNVNTDDEFAYTLYADDDAEDSDADNGADDDAENGDADDDADADEENGDSDEGDAEDSD